MVVKWGLYKEYIGVVKESPKGSRNPPRAPYKGGTINPKPLNPKQSGTCDLDIRNCSASLGEYEPLSKLPVSPLTIPIVVLYIFPYVPPLRGLDYSSYV